jgi:hypothetical protein
MATRSRPLNSSPVTPVFPWNYPQRRQGRHDPVTPRTARAIDLAIGERAEGPIFLTADGAASLVAGRAGLEDGPSDLRAPGGLVGGVGGAFEVVLADGAVDGEGVPGDVGG